MSTIFAKIINNQIPSYKIFEDDDFLAFLDVYPLRKGHVLVVPKVITDEYFDMDTYLISKSMIFCKKVSKSIKASFDCDRVGVAIIGLEVPHAHIHLIPINSANDLNFTQPKLELSDIELKEIQDKLLSNL